MFIDLKDLDKDTDKILNRCSMHTSMMSPRTMGKNGSYHMNTNARIFMVEEIISLR